ncbi:sirohydrochlorin chelatase [Protofrankia symbiont of Coriaria ruscifolia]|uniref:sirohydrochlorin chelatase n=1 Tax=Protofrankia symbiont of Coriaria ruscifolia TaxID=1306542 RepID=UPI001A944BB8|nr:sirohydrochlorin chelatase [Protofrankia symbiont of Coriaria ruscifolia]
MTDTGTGSDADSGVVTNTSPSAPALLIVGHGTRSAAGVAQFQAFVERVGERAGGTPVDGGFIELSRPPVADAVARLVEAGRTRLAAVPLTLVAAGHAKGDIPGALARERIRHPGLRYAYGRPLGPHPTLLTALEERIDTVCPRDERAEVTVLLVSRGSTDPDANAEIAKVARLLWEGRGFAGVEPAFISLAEPSVPAGLERCRLLGASRIVVAPYFLFAGVLPDRVVAQAAGWAADHPDIDVRCTGLLGDCEGLVDLVLERFTEALAGDIRMNCDTCLYRVALPGFEHRVAAPQAPHDHPDDPAHPHGHQHHHGHGHHRHASRTA